MELKSKIHCVVVDIALYVKADLLMTLTVRLVAY